MKRPPNPTILVINPGSTSTKVAVFQGRRRVFESAVNHPHSVLRKCGGVVAQAAYRGQVIRRLMKDHGIALDRVDLFAARGGLLRPIAGGVYAVNEAMLRDLRACTYGEHASNLGAILASDLAAQAGRKANVYIANPVVVDELAPVARITGLPEIQRRSIFHALNQKAVAERAAARLSRPYNRCNLIVAHVGGGISIGVHRRGRVVDVNNALEGDGPFTVERTGGLPLLPFVRHIQAGGLSFDEVRGLVTRRGGLLAHLGTNDCRLIAQKAQEGDRRHRLVLEAFVYQLAKGIAAGAAVVSGEVDAIVLTGNVLKSAWIRNRLRHRVKFIAPVWAMAGAFEMQALAGAALDVYKGKRRAKAY